MRRAGSGEHGKRAKAGPARQLGGTGRPMPSLGDPTSKHDLEEGGFMSTTEQRRATNRLNALNSTGPTSDAGKLKSSRNATRHGLLSNRLLLEAEDPAEFDALLLELQSSLRAVGILELALVERVAVNLWRQRRLVTAETAAISLARQEHKTAEGVSEELKRGYSNPIKSEDLKPFDKEQIRFCKAVQAEAEALDEIKLETLPKLAPTIFGQLESDAEEDGESVAEHAASHDKGLTGYVGALLSWAEEQLREADLRPRILALAEHVRACNLVLPAATIECLSRYQTTLDNQLYKALRALREAQESRLKMLDGGRDAGAGTASEAA